MEAEEWWQNNGETMKKAEETVNSEKPDNLTLGELQRKKPTNKGSEPWMWGPAEAEGD